MANKCSISCTSPGEDVNHCFCYLSVRDVATPETCRSGPTHIGLITLLLVINCALLLG